MLAREPLCLQGFRALGWRLACTLSVYGATAKGMHSPYRDIRALGADHREVVLLTQPVVVTVDDAGVLPTEFRLFRRGLNATTKGEFLFDGKAAELVLAAAAQKGVDLMVDLEHMSLPGAPVFDPDARGWYQLAVRDGELWAVNVRWTPDGATRLTERRQRYISPAFYTDGNDPERIVEIVNVALTAQPATFETPALIAASTTRRTNAMDPKTIKQIVALRADGVAPEAIVKKLAIDIKSLQNVVKAIGGDPNSDLGTLLATVAEYADALVQMAMGKKSGDSPSESSPASVEEDAPAAAATAVSESVTDEVKALRAEREARAKALEQEVRTLRAERDAREAKDKHDLTVQLVKLGGLPPSVAWADDSATVPGDVVSKLSIADLTGWVQRLGGARASAAPTPLRGGDVITSASGDVEVSDYEMRRVELAAQRKGVDVSQAQARYRAQRSQQLSKATSPEMQQRYGRAIEALSVIANAGGVIGSDEIRTLTNPVKPYETFGVTSQRALEEFRLELMVDLSTMPDDWTTQLGLVLPGGSLKDTFPLDFSAVKFAERKGQNAYAETPQTRDISITKKEHRAAKMADLRRLQAGDFAYVRSWQQGARQFARAHVLLRASLIVALLEAGEATYWGYSAEQTTGVEGVYYFATTHKVHPFNPKMVMSGTGAATWSNLQGSGTPLSETNLSAEMDSMLFVPAFDGNILGTEASHILLPTSLQGPARRLFEIQPFRTDGETSSVQLANEHYQSGMSRVHIPQLTGSGATADYYLASQGTIDMGFFPWVLAEDSADEILTWDESSDLYKSTGQIRVEDKVYANAALAWPHGIRKVSGT